MDMSFLESELSSETLAALRAFQRENKPKEYMENEKKNGHENETDMNICENFGMSQFWYDEETSETLAEAAIEMALVYHTKEGTDGDAVAAEETHMHPISIVCIACPSAYKALRAIRENERTSNNTNINNEVGRKRRDMKLRLLEHDKRFSVYGDDFVPYDYNEPTQIPKEIVRTADVVIADPPYLSEECMRKTGMTMKLIAKKNAYMIYNTGMVLADGILKTLKLKPVMFQPKHRVALMNEFATFTNFDSCSLLGKFTH